MVTKFAVISQRKRHCRELDLITRDSNSIQYQKHLQLPAVGYGYIYIYIYIYIYTYMYALSFFISNIPRFLFQLLSGHR